MGFLKEDSGSNTMPASTESVFKSLPDSQPLSENLRWWIRAWKPKPRVTCSVMTSRYRLPYWTAQLKILIQGIHSERRLTLERMRVICQKVNEELSNTQQRASVHLQHCHSPSDQEERQRYNNTEPFIKIYLWLKIALDSFGASTFFLLKLWQLPKTFLILILWKFCPYVSISTHEP